MVEATFTCDVCGVRAVKHLSHEGGEIGQIDGWLRFLAHTSERVLPPQLDALAEASRALPPGGSDVAAAQLSTLTMPFTTLIDLCPDCRGAQDAMPSVDRLIRARVHERLFRSSAGAPPPTFLRVLPSALPPQPDRLPPLTDRAPKRPRRGKAQKGEGAGADTGGADG
jgi:hypothetical protein